MPVITDLCRLLQARHFLENGYERVIWLDADILIFDGEPETHITQLGDADRFRHIIKDGRLIDTSTPLPKEWQLPGWRVSEYSERILTRELVQSMGLNP